MIIPVYENKEAIREFWNSRASLEKSAGTQDLILKEIEIEAVAKYVRDGMSVLDAGCGNGVTALDMAQRFSIDILGIDFAQKMVDEAKKTAEKMAENHTFKGDVHFEVLDILSLTEMKKKFDLIYTERVIINLTEWEVQRIAITNIFHLLNPGGIFVMCENSYEGWEEINQLRKMVGLDTYQHPWHNRYLREAEIKTIQVPEVVLEKVDYFSSTYYFLSRVVNAWLAKNKGEEPDYKAPVNQIAKMLPSIGQMGQGKIWVWRKLVP